jgi:ribosomal protein S18 acetylase RimI-like enzyme
MLGRLFRALAPFHPTLIGTYPLGLAVDGSDLDIACACDDLAAFERALRQTLSELGISPRLERLPLPALVAGFTLGEPASAGGDLAIEIFAQPAPIAAQNGFRHMVIEGQLLILGGDALRARVHALKRSGIKTEPAFAQVLGLTGDPYAALLELETWSREQLRSLVDRALGIAAGRTAPEIEPFTGDRAALLPLFRLADDSDQEIASYLALGSVLVAREGSELFGHVQMIEYDAPAIWELKSVAVAEHHRSHGLGRRLVEAGLGYARGRGAERVLLSTGVADTALLRFYQRAGFRMVRIERDAFTPQAGYPAELFVDGIRLLDRAWLDFTW